MTNKNEKDKKEDKIDISKSSLAELKILAYDMIAKIEQDRVILRQLNNLIREKSRGE